MPAGSPGANRKVMVQDIEYEVGDDGNIEVAVSPSKSIKVTPEAWRAQVEYQRRFRDYPNEMEKTDYTYSYHSKYHGQEIIPGLTIKPNMSRKPISSVRHSSISSNEQTKTFTKEDLNNLYNSFILKSNNLKYRTSTKDTSIDEVDYKQHQPSQEYESLFQTKQQTMTSTIKSILTTFAAICMFVPNSIINLIKNMYRMYIERRNRQKYYQYYNHNNNSTSTTTSWINNLYFTSREYKLKTIKIINSTTNYVNTKKNENKTLFHIGLILLLLLCGAYIGLKSGYKVEVPSTQYLTNTTSNVYHAAKANVFNSFISITNYCYNVTPSISVLLTPPSYLYKFISASLSVINEQFSSLYLILYNCYVNVKNYLFNETDIPLPAQQELFEQHKAVSLLTLHQQQQNEKMLQLKLENEQLQKQISEIKDKLENSFTQNSQNVNISVTLQELLTSELRVKIEEIMKYKNEENFDKLKEDLKNMIYEKHNNLPTSENVSVAFVKKIVDDAIRTYDADKTAATDYALESAGGQVRSIKCTESYVDSSLRYYLFGWPVYSSASSPNEALKPGMAPGQCWAFVGSQGYLVIELSHFIYVTGFTMEHVSKKLTPNGRIDSAPKDFTLWGLDTETSADAVLFGSYTYLDNGETLQYFPVQNRQPKQFKFVELRISSNHGHNDYTCLYRIRVHGNLAVGLSTT